MSNTITRTGGTGVLKTIIEFFVTVVLPGWIVTPVAVAIGDKVTHTLVIAVLARWTIWVGCT
jgi:hypothetical protein